MEGRPARSLDEVTIRPLEKSDGPGLVDLFGRLSPESVYRRFFSPIHDPDENLVAKLLDLDHWDREALAAVAKGQILGVARYGRLAEPSVAEMAIVVEDRWQRAGLSLRLLGSLRQLAGERGISAFRATIMTDNQPAIRMVKRAFPGASFVLAGTDLLADLPLVLN